MIVAIAPAKSDVMKKEIKLVSRFDGLELSSVVFEPSSEPVAVLNVVHGMCGSKDRFIPFMEYMTDHGVACVAHDHRGHGGSIRKADDLGYMYAGGAEALIDDIDLVFRWAESRFTGVRSFILGHSMGSLAVMSYLKASSDLPDGAILCGVPGYSPFAPSALAVSTMLCRMGLGRVRPEMLQNLISDRYNRDFVSEGRNAWVCSDTQVRRSFADDPSHNFSFTLDGSRTLMGLMTKAYSRNAQFRRIDDMSLLMLYGNDDPCAGGPSGMEKAACSMREYGFGNVGIKTYPAMRHEILNEIGKERVWQDIAEFVRS